MKILAVKKSQSKLFAVFTATLLITSLTSSVFAAPTKKPTQQEIDAAKKIEADKKAAADAAAATLNKANQTLKQLKAAAALKAKEYQKAQAELNVATKNANVANSQLKQAQASVSSANQKIGKMANLAYVSGGGFSALDSVLHADGPQDLADRLNGLNAIGANNSAALNRYQDAAQIAANAKDRADKAQKIQSVATQKVAAAKQAADDAKSLQQAEVDRLQAVQDQLAKELAAAQKVRLTLEQQQQLSQLEEANADMALQIPNQAKIWPDIGFTGRSTIRSTQEMRDAAVAYAKVQVEANKKYVWGAEGPTTFDCSGLVYAAYRAAGLGWPNWDRLNSSLYWVATKRVPLTQLVPGDLIFYSYNGTVGKIHHIAIYAGNGMMWEAHSKDKDLLYSSIYSIKGLMPYGGRV